MAGITLAQAEARLQSYLDAEAKVLAGQIVEINGQSLTRANLKVIQEGISYWDGQVKKLSSAASGRGRVRNVAPGW